MAHYAFLDENNTVTEVIVGADETKLINGLDTEAWYTNFRDQVCKRTSYNSRIRGTYAGIGYTYNAAEDVFVTPQPYPSWIREGSFWNAPAPMPDAPTPTPEGDGMYSWDEETLSWVLNMIGGS